jgi:hypothetical protein
MDNEGRRYSAMGARAAPRYPHPLPPPEKGDILMLQNEGTFSRCVDRAAYGAETTSDRASRGACLGQLPAVIRSATYGRDQIGGAVAHRQTGRA